MRKHTPTMDEPSVKACNKLFVQKFGKELESISSPEHCLQEDSKSCGVFCCYYARQICSGMEHIYNALSAT